MVINYIGEGYHLLMNLGRGKRKSQTFIIQEGYLIH